MMDTIFTALENCNLCIPIRHYHEGSLFSRVPWTSSRTSPLRSVSKLRENVTYSRTPMCHHLKKTKPFLTWAFEFVNSGSYKKKIRDLIRNSNEWKFSATCASAQQISDFKIEGMATFSCQRHGLTPKTSRVRSRICEREGRGFRVI
jgi:hypothetical protein